MIRPILLAAALAAAGMGVASAEEPSNKAYYLHLVTQNGVSACGPFEFFKLSRKQVLGTGQLVGGKYFVSRCGVGSDEAVGGTVTKSEVALFEIASSDNPDLYWLWTFQWPLQDGGYWTRYFCESADDCQPANSGTYDLGLGEVPKD